LGQVAEIEATMVNSQVNIDKAVNYNSSGTVKPLADKLRGLQEATQTYLAKLNEQLLKPAEITVGPSEIVAVGREAIAQSFQFWDAANNELDALIGARGSRLSTENNMLLAVSLLLLAVVGYIVYTTATQLRQQLTSLTQLMAEIDKGNTDARARVVSADELGSLAGAFNNMLSNNQGLIQSRDERDRIQMAIMKLLNDVSSVAEGDLTRQAEVSSDATGAIADSFNIMTSQLRQIIGKVQNTSHAVNQSVSDTQAQTEMLAHDAEAQAQNIISATSDIGQIAQTIKDVSATADTSKRVAEQSLVTAREGSQKVEHTINAMGALRDQVQETSKRIKRLGENSQEIGEIVQLIGDIAYRTSVLALNASIQAARAGEAGRGFGVVAEEVDRLSKRSTEAAKRISELVKTAQANTNSAIASMEDNTRSVVEGTVSLQEAGRALASIEEVNQRLANMIGSINALTEQQTKQADTVTVTMLNISQATQGTAQGIKQSANTVNQLAELADDLQASVATFKVGKQGSAAATKAVNQKARAALKG
jgi:methyl-accepting chemotaxis protein